MPRKARIDAPGALHHIMGRGIERRDIYTDDVDRKNFVDRLESVLIDTRTPCYGWALMPNHFHLILRTGLVPISTVMRRLLTGYAISFNHRHKRSGHLFQNRYKSILCQEDPYLLELVAYIHLNPLRGRLVRNYDDLSNYRYSGHSAILDRVKRDFQDVDYVLRLFAPNTTQARYRYRDFVFKKIEMGHRPELVGGGLIRSAGGWDELKSSGNDRRRLRGDERILGESEFVKRCLLDQQEKYDRHYKLRSKGYDIDQLVQKAGRIFNLDPKSIWTPSKKPQLVKARSVVCYWAVRELGISGTKIANELGVTQSAVSRAVGRGEIVVRNLGISLLD